MYFAVPPGTGAAPGTRRVRQELIVPIITVLAEIFPERKEPCTLKEITERLQATIEPGFTYGRVHRAYANLSDNPATAAIVKPVSKSRARPGGRGEGDELPRHQGRRCQSTAQAARGAEEDPWREIAREKNHTPPLYVRREIIL